MDNKLIEILMIFILVGLALWELIFTVIYIIQSRAKTKKINRSAYISKLKTKYLNEIHSKNKGNTK
jgi:hypothetical protein